MSAALIFINITVECDRSCAASKTVGAPASEASYARSVAKEVGSQPGIVSLCYHRYADHGLDGLNDKRGLAWSGEAHQMR
jgi:hypothetical protein